MFFFMCSVSFVVGLVVASLLWKGEVQRMARPRRTPGERFPFRRVERVLSEQEQMMYLSLQREMGPGNLLLTKVRLLDLVELPRSAERRDFLVNLVGSKAVDFVICDESRLVPIIGIQMARRNDDEVELITQVLDSASLPFMQLPNKRSFDPGELNEMIRDTLRRRRRGVSAASETDTANET